MSTLSDDPRLTAYALNELGDAERAEFEALLAADPAAQAEVNEILEFNVRLAAALAAETVAPMSAPLPDCTGLPRRLPRTRWITRLLVPTALGLGGLSALTWGVMQTGGKSSLVSSQNANGRVPSDQTHGLTPPQVAWHEESARSTTRFTTAADRSGVTFEELKEQQDAKLAYVSAPTDEREPEKLAQLNLTAATTKSQSGVRQQSTRARGVGGGSNGQPESESREFYGDGLIDADDSMPLSKAVAAAPASSTPVGAPDSKDWEISAPADQFGVTSGKSPEKAPAKAQPVRGERSLHLATGVHPAASNPEAKKSLQDQRQLAELSKGRRMIRESIVEGKPLDVLSSEVQGNEGYAPLVENAFQASAAAPFSTFGIDVDTASYTNARRFLTQGQLPPADAIRVEECINFFSYNYPQPTDDKPFSCTIDVGNCPWQADHQLVRVGLQGRTIAKEKRPPVNLVFLLDVSGSMSDANKLPWLKAGMLELAGQLNEGDRVAIVTYSDQARVALDSTGGQNKEAINQAINQLAAQGSTNGAGGIQLAYRLAAGQYNKEATNCVILCTDGDFNVGVSDDDALAVMIREKAQSGVFLSVFGYGMGNIKDGKLEKLADTGNGHYGYIDDLRESHRVFVDEVCGTLITIAKDVKLQVEFNARHVGAYRLIGYENRALATQDFRDDKKDAGEIGAGHSVTALYEIIPAAQMDTAGRRYRIPATTEPAVAGGTHENELLTVNIRYKQPTADTATEQQFPVPVREIKTSGSADFQFASAVAAFGMILRDSPYKGQATLDMIQELAQPGLGEDAKGDRREFLELVQIVRRLKGEAPAAVKLEALPAEAAQAKASVDGKYTRLLEKLEIPEDGQSYGAFHDYGHWTSDNYRGHDHLPAGYWVYVYPNWYIWGDVKAAAPE